MRPDLSYEAEDVLITDRSVKTLRRRVVPLVKVLWSRQATEECTKEREDEMRRRFPRLFPAADDSDKRYFSTPSFPVGCMLLCVYIFPRFDMGDHLGKFRGQNFSKWGRL